MKTIRYHGEKQESFTSGDPEDPFDVVVTNPEQPDDIYRDVCSYTLTLSPEHPDGLLTLLFENGTTHNRVCYAKDLIFGDSVIVEVVETETQTQTS
jgi:hypothetical protein